MGVGLWRRGVVIAGGIHVLKREPGEHSPPLTNH